MSSGDFENTYHGTYLRVGLNGEAPVPVLIEGCSEDDGGDLSVDGHNLKTERMMSFNPYASGTQVVWEWPVLGMVNREHYCVYHRRMAQRQYRRGFRISQCSSTVISNDMVQHYLGLRPNLNSTEHIKELFSPTFQSLGECISRVETAKAASCAFDSHWAIGSHPRIDIPTVFYKTNVVGVVKGGKIVLQELANHLQSTLKHVLGDEYDYDSTTVR
jgi:hypothetical protein